MIEAWPKPKGWTSQLLGSLYSLSKYCLRTMSFRLRGKYSCVFKRSWLLLNKVVLWLTQCYSIDLFKIILKEVCLLFSSAIIIGDFVSEEKEFWQMIMVFNSSFVVVLLREISCHRKVEAPPLEVDGGEMFPRECKHSPPLQFYWHLNLLNLFGGSRLCEEQQQLHQHRYYVCRRHFWCIPKLGPKLEVGPRWNRSQWGSRRWN